MRRLAITLLFNPLAGMAVVALLALVLSSPLWLALFIESRVTGGGLFAREVRIGRTRRRGQRRGRRSTVPLDRRSIDRRTQDLCGAPVHCLSFRTDTGPVARFVARHRLEKLPWLLQVLSGEFALVGPKPDRQELVQRWHHLVPRYAERFRVRPGVTGLAQVSGVTDRDADGVVRRVHYDLYYIEHRSLALDLSTLARTMWRICRPMARA